MVTQETDRPVKILKDNKKFFAGYFHMFFNDAITSSKFPSLKMTYAKSVFKKGTRSPQKSCRPISILPLVSKTSERIFVQAISNFF